VKARMGMGVMTAIRGRGEDLLHFAVTLLRDKLHTLHIFVWGTRSCRLPFSPKMSTYMYTCKTI